MANNPQWRDVGVGNLDGRGMQAASQSLSAAGDVFTKIAGQLQARDQAKADLALRQAAFDEQARQFGITSGLDRDKFTESIRQFDVGDENTDLDRAQRLDIANMQNRAAMAGVGATNSRLQFEMSKYGDALKREADLTKVYQDVYGPKLALEQEQASLAEGLSSGTLSPDQALSANNRMAQIDGLLRSPDMSANSLDNRIRTEAALRGFGIQETTPFTGEAGVERERVTASRAAQLASDKAYADSQTAAYNDIVKANLTPGQSQLLSNALKTAQAQYPNASPQALADTLLGRGTYNAWFNFSGQQALEDSDSVYNSFIADPTNPSNPLAQSLAIAARNTPLREADSDAGNLPQVPKSRIQQARDLGINSNDIVARADQIRSQSMALGDRRGTPVVSEAEALKRATNELIKARNTAISREEAANAGNQELEDLYKQLGLTRGN